MTPSHTCWRRAPEGCQPSMGRAIRGPALDDGSPRLAGCAQWPDIRAKCQGQGTIRLSPTSGVVKITSMQIMGWRQGWGMSHRWMGEHAHCSFQRADSLRKTKANWQRPSKLLRTYCARGFSLVPYPLQITSTTVPMSGSQAQEGAQDHQVVTMVQSQSSCSFQP